MHPTTTRATPNTKNTLAALLALALLSASQAARAQEAPRLLDADAARARASAFLGEGLAAPRPDLRPAALRALEPVEVDDPIHGPAFDLLLRRSDGRLRLVVRVDRAEGRVLYFSQPERDCVVPRYDEARRPRPRAEVEEEARARTRFDAEALRARALAFVEHLVPAATTGARRFEVVSQRSERDGLLVEALVLLEAPGQGVLACFRNMIQLDLSPETGEVVSARRTDLRHELRAAPAIDASAAVRLARARAGEAAPLGPPRLEVVPVGGAPGARVLAPAWLVAFAPARERSPGEPRVVAIAADDGRVLEDE